jgi:NAD(P)-dependent dehydrogenase (short-subunit alcohol dehydrogenase family)
MNLTGTGAFTTAFPAAFPAGFRAIVIGATGGIGGAIAAALAADPHCGGVTGLSRSSGPRVDLLDEATLAAAAAHLADGGPYHLIVTAVGVLHDDRLTPEKSLRALDPAAMAASYAINAIGPALVIKHFAPLLPKTGRSVLATLSARVGSIGDNKLGGWYSYRAAKAALNQLIVSASVEVARTRPEARLLALHPGTVATGLSQPFKATHEVFTPQEAAARLLGVMARAERTGQFLAYDGTEIVW